MFKYSQGWIKISTRAVRVLQPLVLASCEAIYHLYLKAFILIYEPIYV